MKDTARSMDIEEFCSWFQQHEKLYSRLEECISEGSSIDMELQLKKGLEGEQWLHLVGVLKKGGSQIQGVLRDISRAKIAEEERKKSEENYRITLNSIGDAVIATDTEGQVTHMNPVAEALTGWTSKEAFGRRLQEVFHIVNETTRLPVSDPVTRVLSTGELVTLENHTVLISKDGKEYLIGDSGAPIFNSERKIIGVVLVFRDMTAEYKTQEELLKVQKLQSVGNLAGGIAHDFNNILTGIYANLDLALANITPGHGAYSYLHEMEKSVDRAKSLATQLLTFSKGGLPLREVVRLKELIESTIRFDLSGSNVQAEIICNDEIWPVEADRGQLAQVFSNLILNASQAMKDGGTIRVTLENVSFEDSEIHKNLNGKFVKIKFRDSGCGIPESILHQIFDPFFTTKSEGTGLGLAVVYSIVERHGGKVEVNSLVNEGTEFTVYIPADENMELMEIPVENLHGESEREEGVKVLVIDDEEMVREVTESMLEFLGYGFDSALNTKEGIAKFNKALEEGEPFKIVITDLTIPGEKGGQDTARILTEIDPSVSVIVTSGYSDGPVMARFKEYGFKGRLVKPFIRAELDAMLQEILHK
jgi:PAS domain S-box-containing protein